MYSFGCISLKNVILLFAFLAGTTLPITTLFVDEYLLRSYLFVAITIVISVFVVVTSQQMSFFFPKAIIAIVILVSIGCIRNYENIGIWHCCSVSFIFLLLLLGRMSFSYNEMSVCIAPICAVELFVCLLQLLGVIGKGIGKCTGTFDNSCGLALFMSLCFPFFLETYKRQRNVFLLLLLLLIPTILLLAESRAGLLSIILILFICKRSISKRVVVCLTIFLLSALVFLFVYKNSSTTGRFLIIVNAFSMPISNIWVGDGLYAFTKEYMLQQAAFFAHSSQVELQFVAGEINHPLNEYIAFFINTGLIGGIALLTTMFFLCKYILKSPSTWSFCIIIICLHSAMTHSLRYPFVWFFTAICISQICQSHARYAIKKQYGNIMLVVFCGFATLMTFADFNLEYRWKKLFDDYISKERNSQYLEEYRDLEKKWHGTPQFYYNYAVILKDNQCYHESIKMIERYHKYAVDYCSNLLLANNYYGLKEYDSAISHFTICHNMCPNRFIPMEGLMKSYIKKENTFCATSIAEQIICQPVKVESYTVSVIKANAMKYLSSVKQNGKKE